MNELLINIGIDNFDSFIYEYEPIKIDWWDSEYETSIEIEIHRSEDGLHELSVIFCPEAEGIVERVLVFIASYKLDSLQNQAFIVKKVCQQLIEENTFELSKEQNTYIIDSLEDVKNVITKFSNLITNKEPICKVNLKQIKEEISYETGSCLDHFIAMMYMNSTEFTKENIIASIKFWVEFEGLEYLTELKNDVDSDIAYDFREDYEVDDKTLQFIKQIIKNYTPPYV